MNIKIKFIPHSSQRYDTVGDWFYDTSGNLIITVSLDHPEFVTKESQILVGIHELVEALCCKKNNVPQFVVDQFDMTEGKDLEEPGEHKNSPYRKEHMFAMLVEKLIAHEWGMD